MSIRTRLLGQVKSESGVTALEWTISTGLTLLIMTGLYTMHISGQKSYVNASEAIQSRSEAEHITKSVVRPLREATFPSEVDPAFESADDDDITFFSDIDNDQKPEKVRMFKSGSQLKRSVLQTTNTESPWQFGGTAEVKVLSSNVRNTSSDPIFRFYQTYDQQVTATPLTQEKRAKIRLLRIRLKIDSDPNIPPGETVLEDDVFLRNVD